MLLPFNMKTMKRAVSLLFSTLFSITCIQNLYSYYTSKPSCIQVEKLLIPKKPIIRLRPTYFDVPAAPKAGSVKLYFYRALGEVKITLKNSENSEGYTKTIYADISSLTTLHFTPETEGDYLVTVKGKNFWQKAYSAVKSRNNSIQVGKLNSERRGRLKCTKVINPMFNLKKSNHEKSNQRDHCSV